MFLRCVETTLEKLVFRTKTASKALATLHSNYMVIGTFQSESTTPVINSRRKKGTDLFNMLHYFLDTNNSGKR